MGHGHSGPTVLIHISGGGNEGRGHIIRSSHLANLLVSMGHNVLVSFAASQEGLIPLWMRAPTYPIHMDVFRSQNPMKEARAFGFKPDVFVLDVMWPREDWLIAKRNAVIVGAGWSITDKVAAGADLLVYQTGWKVKHDRSVSGPEYLMLGPRYGQKPRQKSTSVLVSFGAGIPDIYARSCCEHLPEVVWPETGEMLYGLQVSSRIHAGSMGMSTYESMSQGCVPIVVSRSTDHADTARKMAGLGCLVNCGVIADCAPDAFVAVCRDLLVDDRLPIMAQAGVELIDGKGLERVAKHIVSL